MTQRNRPHCVKSSILSALQTRRVRLFTQNVSVSAYVFSP